MKKVSRILMTTLMFLAFACTAAISQDAPPGFMIIPSGESIILLGQLPPEPGTAGYRIYRSVNGGPEELAGELPLWTRDPNVYLETMGEADFLEFAQKFGAATPAELMHIAGTQQVIIMATSAIVPKYPSLIRVFENSYFFEDTDIEPGAKYEYRVARTDAAGNELESAAYEPLKAVGGEKLTPDTPVAASATEGDGVATLYWIRGTGDRVATYDSGYYIYRQEKDKEMRQVGYVIPVTGEEQSYYDKALENGVEYTYQITAVNLAGGESVPTAEMKVTPGDKVPPLVPQGVTAEYVEGKVLIAWAPNTEEDLSHYTVYRTEDPKDGLYSVVGGNLTDTSVEDVEIEPNGQTYFYSVTATDISGNECIAPSPTYVFIPDYTPPLPPTDIKAEYDKEKKEVVLTWTPPAADDFTIYSFYKGNSPDELQQITTMKNTVTEFRDAAVQQNRVYYFTIRAQDRSANTSLIEEIVEFKIPDATAPPTPFNLQVKKNSAAPELTWTGEKAEDFGEFAVYRATEEKGEYKKIGAADETTFTDSDAEKGKVYWYRISQLDDSGNESTLCTPASGMNKDAEPPATPKDLKAEFKKDGIHLSWAAPADKDIEGYNIYVVDLFRFSEESATRKPVPETEFVVKYTKVGFEGNVGVKITAVDTSGNESEKTELVKPE